MIKFFAVLFLIITTNSNGSVPGNFRVELAKNYPGYFQKRKALKIQLAAYLKKIQFKDQQGFPVICARQVYREAKWYLNYTTFFDKAQANFKRLDNLLSGKESDFKTDQQSLADGLWGRCFNQWFLKLDVTSDQITQLHHQKKTPQFPLLFLEKINSPEKLVLLLNKILVSDIKKEGVYHRKEINYILSALTKTIHRSRPRNFNYHPQLKKTLLNFIVNKWQDPETGLWGPWIQKENKIIKVPDLSITFHLVSYLNGEVPLLGKMASTAFHLINQDYPVGAKENGEYVNHHNYDIVRLFSMGWKFLNSDQKNKIAFEIQRMKDWCLATSLQKDGSFPLTSTEESIGEAYYFGVSFLNEIGYFNKNKRFWTTNDFPESEQIRKIILSKIKQVKTVDSFIQDAMNMLI